MNKTEEWEEGLVSRRICIICLCFFSFLFSIQLNGSFRKYEMPGIHVGTQMLTIWITVLWWVPPIPVWSAHWVITIITKIIIKTQFYLIISIFFLATSQFNMVLLAVSFKSLNMIWNWVGSPQRFLFQLFDFNATSHFAFTALIFWTIPHQNNWHPHIANFLILSIICGLYNLKISEYNPFIYIYGNEE